MNASTPASTPARTARVARPMNGVDVPTLFATLDAVKGQPELAKFTFRAENRWIKGTHSVGSFTTYTGAGGDHEHVQPFTVDTDHVLQLVGTDRGPTPVEMLLTALLGCITAGIGNIASARGIELWEITSSIEGQIDLNGILGLSGQVRNGYQGIRARFSIKGDAPEWKLREIVEQSRARSAVYDVLTNGVPVSIDIQAG